MSAWDVVTTPAGKGLDAAAIRVGLDRYCGELLRWNRTIRLVGPKDRMGIQAQIIDALLPHLHHPARFPLVDIGSGAGLPAIPLAIVHPHEKIVCIEPRQKRVSFLNHVIRTLGLEMVSVRLARSDEAVEAEPALRNGFSTVTARAVADIPTLLGMADPFLAPGGEVALGRGGEPPPEVEGWRCVKDQSYPNPVGTPPRKVVVYVKETA